jgi:hypothetical protein
MSAGDNAERNEEGNEMKYLDICKKYCEAHTENWDYRFGIRKDDRKYYIGKILPVSHVWDDGTRLSEKLDGTSALQLYDNCNEKYYEDSESKVKIYMGKYTYILVSRSVWGGDDVDEWVMNDAELIAIIDDNGNVAKSFLDKMSK